MNPSRLALVLLVLAGLSRCAGLQAATGVVLETPTEFHALGDFDGDGREDPVIVERGTGLYRVAYQASPGKHTWLDARASGIVAVSGMSVGRVLSATRDTLALTSPTANRVNLFEASSPRFPDSPVSWFPPSVGPQLVAALDIGGAGNTALDDLFTVTSLNSGAAPFQQALARSTVAGLTPLSSGVASSRYLRGQLVRHHVGGPPLLGLVADSARGSVFHSYTLESGVPVRVATAEGLPAEARFVHASFSGGSLHQFLFYQPGGTALQGRPLTEPTPGHLEFAAPATFEMGQPITAVMLVPGPNETRLLVLFDDSTRAAVYRFDGVRAPERIQSFTPPPGQDFTGASPLGNSEFLIFQGAIGTGRSTHATLKRWSGLGYTDGRTYALPEAAAASAGANVFLFRKEPFVNPNPGLTQRLSVGDWTSQPALSGDPLRLRVTVETFAGATNGLGSPELRALDEVTPPGAFALANQYLPGISLFSLAPPVGDEVFDVQIQPPPGAQSGAIQVTLSTVDGGADIFFRRTTDAGWTRYSTPLVIFSDAAIQYYAQRPGSDRKSILHEATYTFPAPAGELDSDQDGVPDYVELGLDADHNGVPDFLALGRGLEPVTASKDSDGDGYGDLDELVAGTRPYDAKSVPAAGSRTEDHSGFDLLAVPRPFDGVANARTSAATNVNLELRTLSGELLRADRTLPHPAPAGIVGPNAKFTNVMADLALPLLALSTDAHFPIARGADQPRAGRELVALFPMPSLAAGLRVAHSLGNASLSAEADAWRADARLASLAQRRLQFVQELRPLDTLAALLTEHWVSRQLVQRGQPGGTNLTLFASRALDRGRHAPSAVELRSLETQAGDQPAYRLSDVFGVLSNTLAATNLPSPRLAALRRLSEDVYRVSSAFHDASPGGLPLPVDVWRVFLGTGEMPSNYVARLGWTPAQLAEARSGADEAFAQVTPRPRRVLDLATMADGISSDCTVLQAADGPCSLQFADGSAYLFPASFAVVTGSRIRVEAYTDALPSRAGCPGVALEVISAGVTSVPTVPTLDEDHDLLPDNYERAFFGDRAANALDDADLDGFSNLQEFLDGTDPKDRLARGRTPVRLGPPEVRARLYSDRSVGLSWNFPSAYAPRFRFGVHSSASLDGPFAEIPAGVVAAGLDTYEVQLPPPAGDTAFYRLTFETR